MRFKTITYQALLVLFAIILIFNACKDDDVDNTPPVISIIEPADDEHLSIGSDIHFECDFSDDVELHSYKIEIHDNFDGHNHEKSVHMVKEEEVPFSYSNSWTFDEGLENSLIHHHKIVIPDSIDGVPVAHGAYHFGVYCTDIAGNESHVFIGVILGEGDGEHHHE